MERIATDTYSFPDIRNGGFVYVDKTAILKLLADGSIGKQFFVARPRRFGKSLAISTLQCLFEGRRDLFRGLAIEPEWDWTKVYPVLKLDMGSCQAASVSDLWRKIDTLLESESRRLKVPLHGEDASARFRFMIEDLSAANPDKKMVLLVDEYDKPLLGHLGKEDVNDIRDALKEFYSVVKTCEGYQRFAFITGVSKFSKVSIFSDLNNLNEFSMDARVALLFGYTHEEVKANFPESLAALGGKLGLDAEATFAKLVKWYDGYRFEENAVPVFNPVSIGKCLSSRKFDPYWFETGTPSFLLRMLERDPVLLDDIEVSQTSFSVYEPDRPALMSLLYQTGYLTIKEARQEGEERVYRLGCPNYEVRKAFNESLSMKGYHEKYLRAGKKVTLAGVAFDSEMRNLSDRKIELT